MDSRNYYMVGVASIVGVTILAVAVSSGMKVHRVHKLKSRKNSLMNVDGIDKLLSRGGTKKNRRI